MTMGWGKEGGAADPDTRLPVAPDLQMPHAAMPVVPTVRPANNIDMLHVYTDFNLSEGCFPILLHVFYKFIQHLYDF